MEEPLQGKNLCPPDNITGLILAGGAGRRVDNRDKGTLYWRGRPLMEHVAARIKPQVGTLIVSCNRNEDFYSNFAAHIVSDQRDGSQGPLAGLEAAAKFCRTPLLLLAPCDSPRLPPDLAQRLAAPLLENETLQISYARCGDRDHYLSAMIRRECLDSLESFLDSGQRAVRHWIGQYSSLAVEFTDGDDDFLNINQLG